MVQPGVFARSACMSRWGETVTEFNAVIPCGARADIGFRARRAHPDRGEASCDARAYRFLRGLTVGHAETVRHTNRHGTPSADRGAIF